VVGYETSQSWFARLVLADLQSKFALVINVTPQKATTPGAAQGLISFLLQHSVVLPSQG